MDHPGECESCDRRAAMKRDYRGSYAEICMDVKCCRSEEIKHTRAKNQRAEKADAALAERLGRLVRGTSIPRALPIIFEVLVRNGRDSKQEVAAFLGVKAQGNLLLPALLDCLKERPEEAGPAALMAAVSLCRREVGGGRRGPGEAPGRAGREGRRVAGQG